jgi:hypothetical protein
MSAKPSIILPDEQERRRISWHGVDRLIRCERCGVRIYKSNEVEHKNECAVRIAEMDAREAEKQEAHREYMKKYNRKYHLEHPKKK